LLSHPISSLLQLYIVVVFVRVILSWFPISPDSFLASVYRFVYAITEPVLGPIRRVMPGVGVGGMGLDFSPIIVLLGLQIIVIPLVSRAGL
jgi:YggT family protein